jgi:hypothetical protein
VKGRFKFFVTFILITSAITLAVAFLTKRGDGEPPISSFFPCDLLASDSTYAGMQSEAMEQFRQNLIDVSKGATSVEDLSERLSAKGFTCLIEQYKDEPTKILRCVFFPPAYAKCPEAPLFYRESWFANFELSEQKLELTASGITTNND